MAWLWLVWQERERAGERKEVWMQQDLEDQQLKGLFPFPVVKETVTCIQIKVLALFAMVRNFK